MFRRSTHLSYGQEKSPNEIYLRDTNFKNSEDINKSFIYLLVSSINCSVVSAICSPNRP